MTKTYRRRSRSRNKSRKRSLKRSTLKRVHKAGMRAVGRAAARHTGEILKTYLEGEGQAVMKGQDTIFDKAEKMKNIKRTPNILTPSDKENMKRNTVSQYKPPKIDFEL